MPANDELVELGALRLRQLRNRQVARCRHLRHSLRNHVEARNENDDGNLVSVHPDRHGGCLIVFERFGQGGEDGVWIIGAQRAPPQVELALDPLAFRLCMSPRGRILGCGLRCRHSLGLLSLGALEDADPGSRRLGVAAQNLRLIDRGGCWRDRRRYGLGFDLMERQDRPQGDDQFLGFGGLGRLGKLALSSRDARSG
jgi:hypothetical protein